MRLCFCGILAIFVDQTAEVNSHRASFFRLTNKAFRLVDAFQSTSLLANQLKAMSNILDKIVATKRAEIANAKSLIAEKELQANAKDTAPPRDFLAAVSKPGQINLIAEVKKASPSKGLIREDFQPQEIAKAYAENGAACISVLTDVEYFQGSLDYLSQVKSVVDVPCLRKDFILDSYQITEARAAGADAVLLIAECLEDSKLKDLVAQILDLGMTPLVELYEESNLLAVLESGTPLIGINNRDLRTFEVDLHHTIRLRQQIPSEIPVVGESGIFTQQDAHLLFNANVNAMLVGESLMRQQDIASAVRQLLSK